MIAQLFAGFVIGGDSKPYGAVFKGSTRVGRTLRGSFSDHYDIFTLTIDSTA